MMSRHKYWNDFETDTLVWFCDALERSVWLVACGGFYGDRRLFSKTSSRELCSVFTEALCWLSCWVNLLEENGILNEASLMDFICIKAISSYEIVRVWAHTRARTHTHSKTQCKLQRNTKENETLFYWEILSHRLISEFLITCLNCVLWVTLGAGIRSKCRAEHAHLPAA